MHRQHTAIPLRLNIAIAFISVLVSVWLVYNDPLINRDGITYLKTADAYLNDGLIAAIQLFDRPFLSVISGELHRATNLSLAMSAQLLVTCLYATLCLAFVSTIGLLGGDRRTQIIAALVVLSHPVINGYRSDIMRDPGYWAMGVLAFRQLLLFLRSPHWQHQALWFFYIVLAALFRFEAIAYLCLAPFAVAIVSLKGRRAEVLAGFGLLPLLTLFTLLVFSALANDSAYSTLALFEDIGGYVSKALVIPDFFLDEKAHSSQEWVAEHSSEDISVFLISGTIGLFAINIVRSLTWPWLAILCWGARYRTNCNATDQQLLLLNIHIMIAAIYLFAFVLINRFMLERYAGFLTLMLLLYLPALVDDLLNKRSRMAVVLVSAIFIGMSADTLHNGNREKAYVKDATLWINRQLPHNASLITNYSYIEYFSQLRKIPVPYSAKLQVEDLLLEQSIWMSADYLVISVKSDEQEAWSKFVATFTLETINIFEGGRHGNLYIVKNKLQAIHSPQALTPVHE